jgi:MoaA/NifB/PqqE/SkfB family radical SAM enzyme
MKSMLLKCIVYALLITFCTSTTSWGLSVSLDQGINDLSDIVKFINEALSVKAGEEPFAKDFFTRQHERIKAFFEDKVIPPFEVEIQPSATCNVKCTWCFGKEFRLPDELKNESNMNDVIDKIIAAEAFGFKIASVKFVGSTGDPLVNPYTLKAIRKLQEKNIAVRMFTNGILLDKYAKELFSLNYLRVSLDAGSGKTLEKAKRVNEKYFKKIMKGIRILRDEADRHNSKIKIHTSFVISEVNYKEIALAARKVEKAGAHGIQYRIEFENKFSDDEKTRILSLINEARTQHQNKPFEITLVNEKENLCSEKCYYPYLWATIGSDGQFHSCGHQAIKLNGKVNPLGNLLGQNESFMDVFRGQIATVRNSGFPSDRCLYCPPIAMKASEFLHKLSKRSKQPGFIQALDSVYEAQFLHAA